LDGSDLFQQGDPSEAASRYVIAWRHCLASSHCYTFFFEVAIVYNLGLGAALKIACGESENFVLAL
jgi:hypothetical protein